MKIKFRKVVEYEKGMVSDSNETIKVNDERYIVGLKMPSNYNYYLGRLSTTPTGDWISQYGMDNVSTGKWSYFNSIDDIVYVVTNVIDATDGSVIRSNIKKNAIFGLQYGCIAIDKIIVDSEGEPRTVVVIPFDGTHKWNKVTITIANLCDVVDDIISKYSTLDPSEFRSSKHGGAIAMFESMGLVNSYKAAYGETKTGKRGVDRIKNDPTVQEMYITVLNGRISLLDRKHMQSLRAVCGGDLNVQKIVLNGSVLLSSLKLLSNY